MPAPSVEEETKSTNYFIRYRWGKYGTPRSIVIGAESDQLAVIQFQQLYPKNEITAIYRMTPVKLNIEMLTAHRQKESTQ